ncbi:MAG: hypothetical protein KDC98_01500 [Planctomycetes bacterium]|nr:hypothetical protein [Planctomycetota bacterium]
MLRPLPVCSFAVLLSSLAAQVPYGFGTANVAGVVPRLDASPHWIGNGAVTYRLDRAAPSALGGLFVSTAHAATTLGGSSVLIDLLPGRLLFSAPLLLNASGTAQFAMAIPPGATGLIGLRLFLQAAVADTPIAGALLASSNGIEVEVTAPPMLFVGNPYGSPSPFALLDPSSLNTLSQSVLPAGAVANGATVIDGGRELLVASPTTLAIERGDLTVSPPTWTRLQTFTAPPFGLVSAPRQRLLFTLVGPQYGIKDLVALDGDPTSPSYGLEVGRLPAISDVVSDDGWDVAVAGDRLAIHHGGLGTDLLLVDIDPARTTFLQIVDSSPIPGLMPQFNGVRAIRSSADGTIVFVVLGVGFFTVPSGIHRYRTDTRQWLDHNPGLAGIQAIGPRSTPPGPMITSSDFALARDESFAVVMNYDKLVRLDFDRDDPDYWQLTNLTGSWVPTTGPSHVLTANGDLVLLVGNSPLPGTTAYLIDPFTANISGLQAIVPSATNATFGRR